MNLRQFLQKHFWQPKPMQQNEMMCTRRKMAESIIRIRRYWAWDYAPKHWIDRLAPEQIEFLRSHMKMTDAGIQKLRETERWQFCS